VSNWRDATWEFGWDQSVALGGKQHPLSVELVCVLRSNDAALWKVKENPANQRLELHYYMNPPTGMTSWEYLEQLIGPD